MMLEIGSCVSVRWRDASYVRSSTEVVEREDGSSYGLIELHTVGILVEAAADYIAVAHEAADDIANLEEEERSVTSIPTSCITELLELGVVERDIEVRVLECNGECEGQCGECES